MSITSNISYTNLRDIQDMPTVIQNNHESVYRCYHILRHILLMVERGDSKETIFEMEKLLNSKPKP